MRNFKRIFYVFLMLVTLVTLVACPSSSTTYTVTFNSEGGSNVAAQKVEAGKTATKPADPTKQGYTFDEWLLNGEAYDFSTAVNADITLNASWLKGESYKVTFYSEGKVYAEYSYREGETVVKPADPTRTDYEFVNWYTDEACTRPYVFGAMKDSSINLYAGWRRNAQNTITFVTNCSQTISPLKKYEGETINLDSYSLTKEGYTFEGWYTDEACTKSFTLTTMPAENITLYAKWIEASNVNVINVKYGNVTKKVFIDKSVTSVDSLEFDLENYVLEEWQDESGKALTFPLTVVNNMTVVAKYYSDGLVVRRGILTGYTGLSTEVIIPSSLDGTEITTIGNGECPFEGSANFANITKIVLPEGVTAIGDNAFAGLASLTEVVLPASLASLGKDVFYGCTALTKLDLSGNTTYPYENGVLYDSTKTTILKFIGSAEELVIASSIKEIASNAFAYAKIDKLVVPSTVETIGAYAFSNCEVKELVYAPSINNVAEYSFKDCTSLVSVELGENITSIGTFAFSGCTSLEEVKLASGASSKIVVEGFAFEKCASLKSFDFDKYDIVDGTVFSFAGIETYNLPDGIEKIDDNMFINWTSLKSITIPSSVKVIGTSAFYGCTSLTEIKFSGTSNLEVINSKAFGFTAIETLDFAEMCPNLKEVYANAFEGCTKTITITFPSSMEFFELGALAGLSYLENISVPYAGSYGYKRLLETLQGYIDEGLKLSDIGLKAYEACKAGEDAFIELVTNEIITTEFLFGYVFGRESYENSVAEAQSYGTDGSTSTFYIPASLQNITVTGKYISAYAFASMDTLTKAPQVTSNMRVIGNRAIYYCDNIEEAVFVSGVEKILEGALSINMKMSKVVLPDTVKYIGYDCFYYSKALTEIKLPNNADLYVDDRAFYECTNLASVYQTEVNKKENTVYLENGTFESYVFAGNAVMTTAYLGKNVVLNCRDYTETSAEPYNALFGSMLALEEINLPAKLNVVYNDKQINELPACFFYKLEALRRVNVEGKSINDYYSTNAPATYVILPDGIDTIGYNSFFLTGATNGIEVVITPRSVNTVRTTAFYYSGIEEIDLRYVENFAAGRLISGGNGALTSVFNQSSRLKKVILSSKLTTLSSYMFANCISLDTLGYYDADADKLYCEEGKFILPPNLVELENRAFNNVQKLTEITLPESVKIIDQGVFYQCINLQKVNMPANLEKIGQMAFQECDLLEVVFTGTKLTKVDDAAFAFNTKLIEVIFPEGVTSIGGRIFDGCSSLEKVTIPSTCEEFGRSYAFRDCANLKTIILLGITPPNVDGGIMSEQTLFYNSKTGQRYSSAELKERGLAIYVPAQSMSLYEYSRSTYGGYTRTITGWMIYYDEGLIKPLEYGYYSNGTDSVMLDQDHNGSYITTSGNLPAATRVKVELGADGTVTYNGYTFTFTTVDGYSSVSVNNGTTTTTLTNVMSHYLDPSESERYSYIDANKDGIVEKNVGYKDEVAEKTDYKVDRPIQFRNFLTLSANGTARFVIYTIGTQSTQPIGTSADYCMDLPGHMPTVYYGKYTVNADGTITVSITYLITENQVEVEKSFDITITNGKTNNFTAHNNITYQFDRIDLFKGPMQ